MGTTQRRVSSRKSAFQIGQEQRKSVFQLLPNVERKALAASSTRSAILRRAQSHGSGLQRNKWKDPTSDRGSNRASRRDSPVAKQRSSNHDDDSDTHSDTRSKSTIKSKVDSEGNARTSNNTPGKHSSASKHSSEFHDHSH